MNSHLKITERIRILVGSHHYRLGTPLTWYIQLFSRLFFVPSNYSYYLVFEYEIITTQK